MCVQVYLYTGRGGFKVMERKEVERQAQACPGACWDSAHVHHPVSRSSGRELINKQI